MNTIGIGTWLITEYDELKLALTTALENGYQTIDTAQVYHNEATIGQVLKELTVDTSQLFITTKVTPINYRYHTTKSVEKSLERLGLSKINLVLLHAEVSAEDNLIAYQELIELKKSGVIEHVGVSNFSIEAIEHLIAKTKEVPYCNQIVCSPTTRPIDLEKYCKETGILLIGYSIIKPYYDPNPYYTNSALSEVQKELIFAMSQRYGVSVGQLLNSWAINNGYHIIPKSTKPERVIENFNSEFTITKEDMAELNAMNRLSTDEYKSMVVTWRETITKEMFEKGFLI